MPMSIGGDATLPSPDDGVAHAGLGEAVSRRAAEATSLATRNGHAETLFIAYYSWLKRVLRRRTNDRADAEDVASETFAQIIKLSNLADLEEPRAFLMTIANRVLYKLWRRRDLDNVCTETLMALHGPDAYYSPEDQQLLVEAVEIIDRVLFQLSIREREIFVAFRLENATYSQIAVTHGISQSAVRRVVAKALRHCVLALAA